MVLRICLMNIRIVKFPEILNFWRVGTVEIAPGQRQVVRRRSPVRPLRHSPAGYCLPQTAGLPKTERGPISTSGPSIFSMSPNRSIASDKSDFSSPHATAHLLGGRSHLL